MNVDGKYQEKKHVVIHTEIIPYSPYYIHYHILSTFLNDT